jgi:lipid A 4'-phosphatase
MRALAALALAVLAASGLFATYPALDIATSQLFYDGSSFPIAGNPWVEGLRNALIWAEDGGFVLVVIAGFASAKRPILNLLSRDWAYLALIFLLGPGLIVNGLLKRLWGRARPFMTQDFGGEKHFSRAWEFADQCARNCSFVSGEAAGATALAISICVVLRANADRMPAYLYQMGLGLALLLPLVTAWQRMAAGRHYLSDVVLGTLLVVLVAALLRWIYRPKASRKRC